MYVVVKYRMSLSWNASLLAPDEIAPRHHFLLSAGTAWAGCERYEVTSQAPFPLTQWPGSKPINIYPIFGAGSQLCAVGFNSLPLLFTVLPRQIAFLKWDVMCFNFKTFLTSKANTRHEPWQTSNPSHPHPTHPFIRKKFHFHFSFGLNILKERLCS